MDAVPALRAAGSRCSRAGRCRAARGTSRKPRGQERAPSLTAHTGKRAVDDDRVTCADGSGKGATGDRPARDGGGTLRAGCAAGQTADARHRIRARDTGRRAPAFHGDAAVAAAGGRWNGGADQCQLARCRRDSHRPDDVEGRCRRRTAFCRLGSPAARLRPVYRKGNYCVRRVLVARARRRFCNGRNLFAARRRAHGRAIGDAGDLASRGDGRRLAEERARRRHRRIGVLRGRRRLCRDDRGPEPGQSRGEIAFHRRWRHLYLHGDVAQRFHRLEYTVPVHGQPLHGFARGGGLARDVLVLRRTGLRRSERAAVRHGHGRSRTPRSQCRLRLGSRAPENSAARQRRVLRLARRGAAEFQRSDGDPSPGG